MKIAVFINSRANYGRIKSFMFHAKKSKNIDLKVVLGASGLLSKYGRVVDILRKDGFNIDAELYSIVEGDEPINMAKSTGLGIIEAASALNKIKPDAVLTIADRYETLATAIAASYMNIYVIHTQGGDQTGSIDESVRHAITKLAHIHFPASEESKKKIIAMGEDPSYVFNVGCPGMDLIKDSNLNFDESTLFKDTGIGKQINFKKDYMVVLMHPVTTEFSKTNQAANQLLQAIIKSKSFCDQVIWLWPNIDSGGEILSKAFRIACKSNELDHVHFYKNFPPEQYLILLNNCKCLVGNSSSGLRECGFLGVPVVNIGNRQILREKSINVVDVKNKSSDIYEAIYKQFSRKRYPPSYMLGDGNAGQKMCDILSNIKLPNIQKRLHY